MSAKTILATYKNEDVNDYTTEEQAKDKALESALEWLKMGQAQFGNNKAYKTKADVEEWLGCNVYPLSTFGVEQQG